jgi:hypothetical protein
MRNVNVGNGQSIANGAGVPWHMRPGTPYADARELFTTIYDLGAWG